jgi:nitroreductase
MDLKEAIKNRHSVRRFSNKKLPKELISEILEYAHLAPSAGNLQARDFIIVDDENQKINLAKASLDQMFMAEAPVNIVVCANLNRISPYGYRGKGLYCIQDSAAAVEHILLLAVDKGLSACWIGAFDEDAVSQILELPPHIRPVAIIPIGYTLGKIETTSRINMKLLTHFNKW